MPRPVPKADRAYLPPGPEAPARDMSGEEWDAYADALSRTVREWLDYLRTGERHVTRSVMRFVHFTTTQDPESAPLYAAECLTGCGETSGSWCTPHEVDRWMAMHSAGTGHAVFRRTFSDHAVVTRTTPR